MGEAFAKSVLVVRKTWGVGDDQKESPLERIEMDIPVELVTPQEGDVVAKVTQGVNTKVSDNVRYGDGAWDKIVYSVDVFSSVQLSTPQTAEGVIMAQNLAHDLAREAGTRHLQKAVEAHVMNITTNLFKTYFE